MPPKKQIGSTIVTAAAKPKGKTVKVVKTVKASSAKASNAKPSSAKASKTVKTQNVTKTIKTMKTLKKDYDTDSDDISIVESGEDTTSKSEINPNGKYILVIVESPGKIKKLESILGKDYVVMSSFGHIMDLYPNKLSVDIEDNFKPEYTIIKSLKKFSDKTKVVADLRKAAANAKKVIIAADEDREGEMIGWSYKTLLNLKNPDRITFHSITKDEVMKAVKSPRKLDMKMVESQKTRRILDRLVGFKISPGLNNIMGMRNLSAGRVQSIVTRIICDKEDEIIKFFNSDQASYFKFGGEFKVNANMESLKCELYTSQKTDSVDDDNVSDDNVSNDKDNDNENENEDNNEKEDKIEKNKGSKLILYKYETAKSVMQNISVSDFVIGSINKRTVKSYPSPPYTTSTVQQDASTRLGFSVKRTMSALQKLYEAGLTTYLRTDSTILSKDAMIQCEKYIKKTYGEDLYNRKEYSNKKQNTQEAHEAIRPVNIDKTEIDEGGKIGSDEIKMYELVWRRTVASQMVHCEKDSYDIDISISKLKTEWFRTNIVQILSPGFLKVYGYDVETDLTKIPKKGSRVTAISVKCSEDYKKPPMRYTEAKLVKMMDPKNLNIGRPATYAETINTIQKRKYVEIKDVDGVEKKCKTITWTPDQKVNSNSKSNSNKTSKSKSSSDKIPQLHEEDKTIHIGKEKNKFCPTELGMSVNNIMMRNFPDIMDYKFTSKMEDSLDEIAEGNIKWVKVLSDFWAKLDPLLQKLTVEKKVERVIGIHPDTGYEIIATMGYYGPMLSMQRDEDTDNKKNNNITAPIKKPLTIEKITLEEALDILKYPKNIGIYENKPVELKIGKFGPYVVCGKKSSNVPEDIDPDDLDLEAAIELLKKKEGVIKEKQDKYMFYAREKTIEYIINNGKFGRYLMVKDISKKKAKPLFVPVSADEDLEEITLDRVKEIQIEGKANKGKKKPATSKASNKKQEDDKDVASTDSKAAKPKAAKPKAAKPKAAKAKAAKPKAAKPKAAKAKKSGSSVSSVSSASISSNSSKKGNTLKRLV